MKAQRYKQTLMVLILINENNTENGTEGVVSSEKTKKKCNKLLWSVLFIFIAALSIWAVVGQSCEFSVPEFLSYVGSSMNVYMVLSFLSMLGFVVFEGLAVLCICRSMGYKRSFGNGMIYSAADIYFSAITPSASGGQPASAYFMVMDGIPMSVVTVSLLVNLVMYTVSIIVFGVLAFILDFSVFFTFNPLSKALIVAGIIVQCFMVTMFIFLLKKGSVLYRLGCGLIRILSKIRLIRDPDKKRQKLRVALDSYKGYVAALGGKRRMLIKSFILNLLQRASLVSVVLFAYLATGGAADNALKIWVTESMTILGANSVPIPGAMGIVDYILLDGFGEFMDNSSAVNLELLSRGISFYFCVFICGVSVLVKYVASRFKIKKKSEV